MRRFPSVRRLLTLGAVEATPNRKMAKTRLKMVCALKQMYLEGLGLKLQIPELRKCPAKSWWSPKHPQTPKSNARVEETTTTSFSPALQQLRQDDDPTDGNVKVLSPTTGVTANKVLRS